jgi:omega-hydroxy-beta-dihydromenaquinone-9 sulfotransferase
MGEPSRRGHGFWANLRYQLTFNSFIRPDNFVRLAHYLPEISPRYWPRAGLIGIISLAALPLRWTETMFFGRRIANTRIDHPPIFIIGHWRSGTTHLHNLFSHDPALGWVSMYQAIAPDCSLIGSRWLKQALAWLVPLQRPMDNMVWPIDAPQEEEVALGKVCAWSFYAQFMFPRHAREFFAHHVLLQDTAAQVADELSARYLRILQIATLHAGGRRLVLKNPVNTARIRLLLTLFPDAKFIHIHRSPYEVFASTRNLHHRIMAFTTLQKLNMRGSAETVFALYEGMMRRFLADRPLIPPGNFAQIRFSDLERDPIGEMSRLYDELGLPGFEVTESALRRYIARQADYRKNNFRLTPEERARVKERWGFAFDAFGYRKVPSPITAEAPFAAD